MQPHAVHILKLAVEVTELRSETLLEGLKFRSDVSRLLEEHIKFSGVAACLELFIGGHQFLTGVFPEPGPVHHHAHLAGLQFLVVLILLVLRTHGTVKVLPLR